MRYEHENKYKYIVEFVILSRFQCLQVYLKNIIMYYARYYYVQVRERTGTNIFTSLFFISHTYLPTPSCLIPSYING
jgi:hypothetical protein